MCELGGGMCDPCPMTKKSGRKFPPPPHSFFHPCPEEGKGLVLGAHGRWNQPPRKTMRRKVQERSIQYNYNL